MEMDVTHDENKISRFFEICSRVEKEIQEIEKKEKRVETVLQRQRKAILGERNEVDYYLQMIRQIVNDKGFSDEWYPPWYVSLPDAVFHEILGFAGLVEWVEARNPKLAASSSAKVVGERIYFMIDGKMQLQPQRITEASRLRIRDKLILSDPKNRRGDPYQEVYLIDGTRVTIFQSGVAKKDQETFIFRKFFVRNFTFDEQAHRGTIPGEAIPLFESMVKVGYNVAFVGAVRTAKTTFLSTWQSYEDPVLEGVMVETDPEIPLHELIPDAPIVQLVPDENTYARIMRNIMRSDADYLIIAEARDGMALNLAVKAANKGTRRVKMTFHTTDVHDFCYDVADEIYKEYGGDLQSIMAKTAKSFHYVFHFVQLPDKSKKRLKGLWEVRYNRELQKIEMHQICRYRYMTDDWEWKYTIGKDKEEIGIEESPPALHQYKMHLQELAKRFPMHDDTD